MKISQAIIDIEEGVKHRETLYAAKRALQSFNMMNSNLKIWIDNSEKNGDLNSANTFKECLNLIESMEKFVENGDESNL